MKNVNITNYSSYCDDTVSGVIRTKNTDTGEVVAILCYEYMCKENILCILFVTVKDKENQDIILCDLRKFLLEVEKDVAEQGCSIKSIEELLIQESDIRMDEKWSDLHLFMKYLRNEV